MRQRRPYRGEARWERLGDKRYDTDPTYMIGQMRGGAPVKYSRCKLCKRSPHHAPEFWELQTHITTYDVMVEVPERWAS